MNTLRPDEAVILVGGLGRRLRAVVPDLPKPMAPVAGRPFLAHLLAALARQGVRRAVLAVGWRKEALMTAFGHAFGGMELAYAIEEEPLGTANGIRLGLGEVRGERAFVLNGDTLFDAPLSRLTERAGASGFGMAMALKPMPDCSRYGLVRVEGERVTGFEAGGRPVPGLINGGLYLLPVGLRHELAGCASFERDFLHARIGSLEVAAVVCDGFFIDIGIPEDYAAAQALLADGSFRDIMNGQDGAG